MNFTTHTMTHENASKPAIAAISMPNLLLRLEGFAFFAAAIVVYASQQFSGLAFVLLLLVPDISMLGYLVNTRVGSRLYNAAHVYTLPLIVIGLGVALSTPLALQIGLIWFAHIGMDRVAGYGLKYATSFKDTHMQRV